MPSVPAILRLLTLLPCTACATLATQAGASRAANSVGARVAQAERRVFVSRLSAEDARPSLAPAPVASQAWGTVRIVVSDNDSFEYLATIYNPQGETFTAATLRRAGEERAGASVAVLFADVALRSKYIQLRGTISVSRDERVAILAEELRERPKDFAIRIFTAAGPSTGALNGAVE